MAEDFLARLRTIPRMGRAITVVALCAMLAGCGQTDADSQPKTQDCVEYAHTLKPGDPVRRQVLALAKKTPNCRWQIHD
jgi:hypothetical protein